MCHGGAESASAALLPRVQIRVASCRCPAHPWRVFLGRLSFLDPSLSDLRVCCCVQTKAEAGRPLVGAGGVAPRPQQRCKRAFCPHIPCRQSESRPLTPGPLCLPPDSLITPSRSSPLSPPQVSGAFSNRRFNEAAAVHLKRWSRLRMRQFSHMNIKYTNGYVGFYTVWS